MGITCYTSITNTAILGEKIVKGYTGTSRKLKTKKKSKLWLQCVLGRDGPSP